MDFTANTIKQRAWFVTMCAEVDSEHELWYLDLTDEQCLSQIAKRRIERKHTKKHCMKTLLL